MSEIQSIINELQQMQNQLGILMKQHHQIISENNRDILYETLREDEKNKLQNLLEKKRILQEEFDRQPFINGYKIANINLGCVSSNISNFWNFARLNYIDRHFNKVNEIAVGNPKGISLQFAEIKRNELFNEYIQLQKEKLELKNSMNFLHKWFLSKENINAKRSRVDQIQEMQNQIISDDKLIFDNEMEVLDYHHRINATYDYLPPSQRRFYQTSNEYKEAMRQTVSTP